MNNVEIGERIRELRENKHLIRDELAAIVGISPKFLYEIELGQKGFSAKTLVKLSKALSVSCDYIMFGVVETKNKKLQSLINILLKFDDSQISKVDKIIRSIYEMV